VVLHHADTFVRLPQQAPKKPKRRISWSDERPESLPLLRVAPKDYYSESEGEEDDDGARGGGGGGGGGGDDDDEKEEEEDELSTPPPPKFSAPKRVMAPSLDIKGPVMQITERQDGRPDDDAAAFSVMHGDDAGGGGGALMF
jgi:hypothetical protein